MIPYRRGVPAPVFYAIVVFAVLVSLFGIVAPAHGQVVDSITIQVWGEPTALTVSGPDRGYVGDTLTYVVDIVDENGDPTIGVLTWEVQDTTRARIVLEGEDYLQIELLRSGPLTLLAYVERFDLLAVGGTYGPGTGARQGDFQWAMDGPFELPCEYGGTQSPPPATYPCANDPTVALCAVGFAGDRPVVASNDDCATAVGVGAVSGDLNDWDRTLLAAIYERQIRRAPFRAFKNWESVLVNSNPT